MVDPVERGRVLHFFANHELLALELMAVALLRFPDAPHSFRRGIIETMKEEQKHLNLYIESMNRLGVGSQPGFLLFQTRRCRGLSIPSCI